MVELTTPSIVVDVLPLNCNVDEQIVPEPLIFELLLRTRLPFGPHLPDVEDELEDELLLEDEKASPELDRTLTSQIIDPINNKIIVNPIEPIIAGARSD